MKRYNKFVLEAEKGITFEISEGTSDSLIIRATVNAHSENYKNPPIPNGYKHVCGEWYNGFVIERISDGSRFVWIPVGSLAFNGTLDGKQFVEQFGRRNFYNDLLLDSGYSEALTSELREQIKSVKKYGGFYISCYFISKSSAGKPQSVKGAMPWTKISWYDAKKVAATIEDNKAVKSHLTFGSEYDSIFEWLIENQKINLVKFADGLHEKAFETNNIYDFAGDMDEWTQEQNEGLHSVVERSCIEYSDGLIYTAVSRRVCCSPEGGFTNTGFRAVLGIK